MKFNLKKQRSNIKNITNDVINNYLNIEIIFNVNNEIVIKNYNEIILIDSKVIIIDNIQINGVDLFIESLDEYQIMIRGTLKEVKVLNDEE